ncbi:hypothetical protein PM082_001607 [Marasmius tenuissimus]|nr:hypothetical protein PM082_001607 [Marasmius tenuissimus]
MTDIRGPSIPPELICNTLEFVPRHDLPTLRSCALVSWAWYHSSRRILFRHIALENSKESYGIWLERLKSSPRLTKFVTHITLLGKPPGELTWDTTSAIELAQHLSHVRSVSVKSLHHQFHDGHRILFENLLGLRTLYLRDVSFEGAAQLFENLGKVPGRLSSLSLQRVGGQVWPASFGALFSDSGYVSSRANPDTTLHDLTLSSSEMRVDVLSWLLGGSFNLSRLRSLVLSAASFHSDHNDSTYSNITLLLEELFKAVGSSLRTLTIGVHRERPGDNSHLAHITSNSMLKHLHSLDRLVIVSECAGVLRPAIGLAHATKLIPHISPGSLREIVIALDLSILDFRDLPRVRSLPEWTTLDEHIHLATYNSFRRLFIIVDYNAPGARATMEKTIESVIREALPKSNARNVLDIHVEHCHAPMRVKHSYLKWLAGDGY